MSMSMSMSSTTPSRIRYNENGRRQGKLLTLQGVSNRNDDGSADIEEAFLYIHVASFLAFKHVQERNGIVISSLPERLATCDFEWAMESRDSQFSPLTAVKSLLEATQDPNAAITGTSTSGVTLEEETTTAPFIENMNDYWTLPSNAGSLLPDSSEPTLIENDDVNEYWTLPEPTLLENDNNLLNEYWTVPDQNDTDAVTMVTTTQQPTHDLSSVSPSEAPSLSPTDDSSTHSPTQRPSKSPTRDPTEPPPTQGPTSESPTTQTKITESPTQAPPSQSPTTSSSVSPTHEPPRTVPPRTDPPLRTSVPLARDTQPPNPVEQFNGRGNGNTRRRRRKRRLQEDVMTLSSDSLEDTNTTINTTIPPDPEDWQFPFGIAGAVFSSVTSPLSLIGGQAYELPQISGTATSASLDESPLFARTIPTNAGDAKAIMLYYQSIGVTHVACLYIKDSWGNYYNADLQQAASVTGGIHIESFSYDENEASIASALALVKQSGLRYIYAIMFDWRPVLLQAHAMGLIANNQHVWIGAEMFEWTSEALQLSRNDPDEMALAEALRGVGSMVLGDDGGGGGAGLETAMHEFVNDTALQQEYIATFVAPQDRHLFDNYTFVIPGIDPYQKLYYDAIYGLAIAACETPGLFTGPELYHTLTRLEYEGVTGKVYYDHDTGTRNPDTVIYRLDNVVWSETRSDDEFIRFDTRWAASITNGKVAYVEPFLYHDNTTTAPLAIPAMEHEYYLIPLGAQVVGWLLGGFVVLLSLGIMAWTWYNRKLFVVRASQPVFLCQLCMGTLVMALAVIPMSMQGTESTPMLNAACMTTPWLIFLGFVTAFSALFSKTWRLNKLMGSGMGMRRIEVQAIDVIWPFVVLMTINVAMLTGWSIVAPSQYIRVNDNNYDEYGRSLESWGQCKSTSDKYLYFLIPMLFFNMLGVATATYQSYMARNLPTTLSESSYLAVSMASLVESLFLGGPMLFMVMDSPTAFYLVGSFMLFIVNMTILLPVFVPKYKQRNTKQRGRGGTATVVSSVRPGVVVDNTTVTERGVMHIARASTGPPMMDYSSGTNGHVAATSSELRRSTGMDSSGSSHSGAVAAAAAIVDNRRVRFQGLPAVDENKSLRAPLRTQKMRASI